MAESWCSSVSKDLDKVEALMKDTVRTDNKDLAEICNYVLHSNGKRIRPAMCILAFHACGGKDPKKAIDVGTAIEIIHNATLVHDDINDRGELRRGAKAAYRKYSISRSIIAGDFLFALGFRLIGSTSPEIVDFIVDASSAMSAGEFDQKDFEHDPRVSEEDYMKIIEGKTASLIECAAKSGSFLSGADPETIGRMGEFAFNIGRAFQIIDDTLDIFGKEEVTGKKVGSDIMEGKPTLPIIYAMEDRLHGMNIRKIFETKELEWSDVREAIELAKKTDAFSRCISKAEGIVDASIPLLDAIDDSVHKRSLEELARYIVSRDR